MPIAGDRFVVEGGRPVGGALVPGGQQERGAARARRGAPRAGRRACSRTCPTSATCGRSSRSSGELGVETTALADRPRAPRRRVEPDARARRATSSARRSGARSCSRPASCTGPAAPGCRARAATASAGGASTPTCTRSGCSAREVELSERQYRLRLSGRFRGGDIFLDEAERDGDRERRHGRGGRRGAHAHRERRERAPRAGPLPPAAGDGRAHRRRRDERARHRGRAGAPPRAAPDRRRTTSRSAPSSRSRR